MQALRVCGRLMRTMQAMAQGRTASLSAIVQLAPFHNSSRNQSTQSRATGFEFQKQLIPKGTTLPHTFELKGERLRMENITADRAEAAWTVLNKVVEKGQGYPRDEVEPLEEFRVNIANKNNYFELIHEDDDDIMAIFKIVGSTLSRSEKAAHFSGPVVLNERYRFKRYGRPVLGRLYLELGQTVLGYPGASVARTVVGSHIVAFAGYGLLFNGIIPNCTFIEGTGRMMDLIVTQIDTRHFSKALANTPAPVLPPLVVMDKVPEHLQFSKPLLQTFQDLSINGLNLKVKNASSEDIWLVERMVRQSAQDADGFAIDEFTKDGHFNRKFLFESHVVVAKTPDDSIAAAAIFGPTALCRSYNPEQVGGYVLVNPAVRRRGIGSALVQHLWSMSKEMGVTSILTDAFACNLVAHQFMDKMDFIVTATMPHCGYVLGRGYRPSYMYWRSV